MANALRDELEATFGEAVIEGAGEDIYEIAADAISVGMIPLLRAIRDLAYSDRMTSADLSGEGAQRAGHAEEYLEELIYRLEAGQ